MLRPVLFFWQLGARAVASAASLAAGAFSSHAQRQRFSGLAGSDTLTGRLPAEQLSPLQRCLRAHDILDVSYWGQPRFAKYASEEYVRSNVEPKLEALEAHGLRPQHLEPLLRANKTFGNTTLLPCLLDTFTTNLEDLVEVMSGYQPERTPCSKSKADLGGLSTVGQIIARRPHVMLFYLSSSPGSLATMRQWFRDELQVTGTQLGRLVWKNPELIKNRMGPHVLGFLNYLDELKGEAGWGRALLLRNAVVAAANLGTARGNVKVLQGFGMSVRGVVGVIDARPAFLSYNLSGPVYQQKFAWIREESPWGMSTFLQAPGYLDASLKKMASRLDFMRQHGLPDPSTPNVLSSEPVGEFCRVASHDIGRIVTVVEFEAWVEGEWLPSAQGQRWGKPPSRQQHNKG